MAEMRDYNWWRDPVRQGWWPYCPLVVLALIMLLVNVSMYCFGDTFVWNRNVPIEGGLQGSTKHAIANAPALFKQEASRVLWVYTVAVEMVLIFGALVAGYGIILALFWNSQGQKRTFLGIALGISVIVFSGAFSHWELAWYENSGMASQLLETYLGNDGRAVFTVVNIDIGLHFAGAWLYMVVASAILSFPQLSPLPQSKNPDDSSSTTWEEEVWQYASAMRLIRLMLYIFAGLLVIYVVSVSTLFHWTLAYVNPEQKDSIQALTTSTVTMRSIQATALISAIYLPSALILRMLTWELASRATPDKSLHKQEEWLKEHGLASSTNWDQLKPIAAILAPLLTGPLVELLQGFLK